MRIKDIIIIYCIAAFAFFIVDLTWLGLIAKGFYQNHLGNMLRDNTNWIAAVSFYSIYIGGILYFAVLPSIHNGELKAALIKGALLGFLCYSTFELTAFALIINWPAAIVIPDIIWGVILTSSVSYLTHLLYLKILK